MPELPRYQAHRIDVATPETPTPSGRNPQAELLMHGGHALLGTAMALQQVVKKRQDLASDTQANERFRLLQEQTYAWEAEKEKTADPDAHAAQQNQFIQESVNKLISDTKDPMVVQKFLTKASGFRVDRLHHAYGVQNRAFVDREKADTIAETQTLGKYEYLYTDAKFEDEWGKLMDRFDKSEAVGGMTKEERVVAEQKARDTIWGTRAYRQAVQAQPKNDDPFGTAVMWEATKKMEMGVDKRYAGLSSERRIAITSQMREEYTRRLTMANTDAAEKRRIFNEDKDSMEGVLLANVEQAARGEEFMLDGKMGKHSIEDVQQVVWKYSAVLGSRVNAIQDNARAYAAIRDRPEKRTITPEDHDVKVKWMIKAHNKEVTPQEIANATDLLPEHKGEVLRIAYQKQTERLTPEQKERNDEVKDLGKFIKRQLDTQTSAFIRDPRVRGISDRAALEFTSRAKRDPDANLADLASEILIRNADHVKGVMDPKLLHSQLPDRYKDMDEDKIMEDWRAKKLTQASADYYLIQVRFIKAMRATQPATQGPQAPPKEEAGYLSRARKFLLGGGAQARPPQPED